MGKNRRGTGGVEGEIGRFRRHLVPVPGAAIVDRVTFNAHTLETGTRSYRLRTTKTSTALPQARLTTAMLIPCDLTDVRCRT